MGGNATTTRYSFSLIDCFKPLPTLIKSDDANNAQTNVRDVQGFTSASTPKRLALSQKAECFHQASNMGDLGYESYSAQLIYTGHFCPTDIHTMVLK